MTNNFYPDKYGYSDYGMEFEARSDLQFPNKEFGVDNSSSSIRTYWWQRRDILVLSKDPTDGLDDTTITTQAKYSVNITSLIKETCLSLHYNAANNFLNANWC